MAIDFATFPEIKINEIVKNDIKIIAEKRNEVLIPVKYSLYENDNLWMEYIPYEINTLCIKQLYSLYDLAYGDVLLSGLGFGVLPLWIKNKKNVKSITVVEKNKNIIDIFNETNKNHNLNIINDDINIYSSKNKYDFIGLDHYEKENSKEIISNSKKILKNLNYDSFWIWPLEKIYLESSFDFSNKNIKIYKNLNHFDYCLTHKINIFSEWGNFVNKNYNDFNFIKNIDIDKVKEYVYTYYCRNNLLEQYKDINRV